MTLSDEILQDTVVGAVISVQGMHSTMVNSSIKDFRTSLKKAYLELRSDKMVELMHDLNVLFSYAKVLVTNCPRLKYTDLFKFEVPPPFDASKSASSVVVIKAADVYLYVDNADHIADVVFFERPWTISDSENRKKFDSLDKLDDKDFDMTKRVELLKCYTDLYFLTRRVSVAVESIKAKIYRVAKTIRAMAGEPFVITYPSSLTATAALVPLPRPVGIVGEPDPNWMELIAICDDETSETGKKLGLVWDNGKLRVLYLDSTAGMQCEGRTLLNKAITSVCDLPERYSRLNSAGFLSTTGRGLLSRIESAIRTDRVHNITSLNEFTSANAIFAEQVKLMVSSPKD